MKNEISCLLDRDCFQVVNHPSFGNKEKLLGGRYAMAINNFGTKIQILIARYLVEAHRDKEKGMLTRNSPTLKH